MGCPARLICRQPPASVASFVVHHVPVLAPGRSCGCWWETSRTMELTWVFGEAVLRVVRPPSRQVHRGAVLYRPVDDRQQRQVDVEGIGDAPGPDPDATAAGRLAGHCFQHEGAFGGILAGLPAGQGVQPQGLPPVSVGAAEGHPEGQVFVVGPVEVHLELVARLRVESGLRMQAVDVRVDVHDEHRAGVAGEDVQVVDEKLPVLGRQRRIQVMRHAKPRSEGLRRNRAPPGKSPAPVPPRPTRPGSARLRSITTRPPRPALAMARSRRSAGRGEAQPPAREPAREPARGFTGTSSRPGEDRCDGIT